MNKVIVWIVIILVIIIGAVWISNKGADEGISQEEETIINDRSGEGEEATPTEAVMEDGVINIESFNVSGREFSFSPGEIKISEGDTVKIVFKNDGTMSHDFRVDEFNVATKILEPGEEETIEFVANQAGTFEYYCSVGNHRANGMVGNLVVE